MRRDEEISLCLSRVLPFGPVPGSLSDLLGLRLSLPLQSRPAQISDGTQDRTEQLEFCRATSRPFPVDRLAG